MTQQFHDVSLSEAALAQLFNEARSYNDWLYKPVTDDQIRAIWDLVKIAPTSANMQPARIIWVRSDEEKAKLAECVMPGNKDKILAAPVTAVIGYDIDYHEELPWLFPHTDAKSWFDGNEPLRVESALRNSSLQGAYLILAARAIGLDCGPMSGFDVDAVNAAFFSDEPRHRVNFLCSLGYGDPQSVFERSPRPDFETFNRLV
ncbi:MAG: malonic semialdehyde reductase [Pseudomonadota bacterium]